MMTYQSIGVMWLEFVGEGLSDTAEIGALLALTQLDLCDNNLSRELPPELGCLASLTELFLDNNYFSGSVPSSLLNLTNLSYLLLHNNNFNTDVLPNFI